MYALFAIASAIYYGISDVYDVLNCYIILIWVKRFVCFYPAYCEQQRSLLCERRVRTTESEWMERPFTRALALGNIYGLIYQFDNTQNKRELVVMLLLFFFSVFTLVVFFVHSFCVSDIAAVERNTRAPFPAKVNEIFGVCVCCAVGYEWMNLLYGVLIKFLKY